MEYVVLVILYLINNFALLQEVSKTKAKCFWGRLRENPAFFEVQQL